MQPAGPNYSVIATTAALIAVGFRRKDDHSESLIYDFEGLQLSAIKTFDIHKGGEIVNLSGILNTTRIIEDIDFNLPPLLDSVDQCKAILAYFLRRFVAYGVQAPWMEEGSQLSDLLPWRKIQPNCAPQARCVIEREWFKLSVKNLKILAEEATNAEFVSVYFDGKTLIFETTKKSISVSAEGQAWIRPYIILLAPLQHLPKRYNHPSINILVYNDYIIIDNLKINFGS